MRRWARGWMRTRCDATEVCSHAFLRCETLRRAANAHALRVAAQMRRGSCAAGSPAWVLEGDAYQAELDAQPFPD